MEDSLQRWCAESLATARQQLPIASSGTCIDDTLNAERFVEDAAFLKLVKARGAEDLILVDGQTDHHPYENQSLSSLVESCPLFDRSPVEVLGIIHEYLVSRRGLLATASGRRRSKSQTANGVFYTPAHVIDYIVHQTVGRRLEQMSPAQVEQLAILDPAAGSGAFLLAAYRCLLGWHLNWYTTHQPDQWPADVERTDLGWQLTLQRRQLILANCIFGVDLDANAIEVARRTLWLIVLESPTFGSVPLREGEAPAEPGSRKTHRLCGSAGASPSRDALPFLAKTSWDHCISNLRHGHALLGPAFGEVYSSSDNASSQAPFDWSNAFPSAANRGGFDFIIGNPPYRREKDFKRELDDIGTTPLGRHRSPRMDLWYYFLHRGIELLRPQGTLSFITNAYWIHGTGSDKLIAALREQVHLDELFLLQDQPIFPGVSGHHLILRLTRSASDQATTIKIASSDPTRSVPTNVTEPTSLHVFSKTRAQLFRDGRLDVWPAADQFLDRLQKCSRLIEFGIVRQGIAENPASINRRTFERFRQESSASNWVVGEGVFSLNAVEINRLELSPHETELLRPYHDLSDLGRYWSATNPSRRLIYSTRQTCAEITDYSVLHQHLARFRPILDARRETRSGSNRWWHLHWPRDERIWRAKKLVILQMANRPSCVSTIHPTYVSFSANVFVPATHVREDLRYLSALLNSKVLWAWFIHHAKHRGIGLELNGHVLAHAPIRRIDFRNAKDVQRHDELNRLVDLRMKLERSKNEDNCLSTHEITTAIESAESCIDAIVATLYGLELADVEIALNVTGSRFR